MNRKLVVLVTVLLAFVPSISYAQNQILRIQWEIDGPMAQPSAPRPPFDVTTAQGYIYKLYIVGSATGIPLTSVQCTTTADPFIKTCAATVPSSLSAPGLSLDMTTTVNGIESPHSQLAIVPPLIIPPTAPANLRMFRVIEPGLIGGK